MPDIYGPGTHVTLAAGASRTIDIGEFFHSTDSNAVRATGANVALYVLPTAILSSGAGAATVWTMPGADNFGLVNLGTIRHVYETGAAIQLSGNNNLVEIGLEGDSPYDGDIFSYNIGIWLRGGNTASTTTINNYGVIVTGGASIMRDGAEKVVVFNAGAIQSFGETEGTGVYADFHGGDDHFTNEGWLDGRLDFGGGNDIFDGSRGQHRGGGLLGGDGDDSLYDGEGDNVIFGEAGTDTLGGGIGADYMSGGSGSDRASYINSSSGLKVSLATPSQNTGEAKGDTYNSIENLTGSNFNDSLTGSDGANRISGANGNDTINGLKGNDVIFGGSGNDRIYGHLGNDTLEGNAGNDTFIFHTALGATNIDTITDFNAAQDTIELWNDVFTTLGAGQLTASAFKDMAVSAKDANDRIIYNSDTGILYYDADGSGTAYGNVKFAVLDDKPILTASDFFVV